MFFTYRKTIFSIPYTVIGILSCIPPLLFLTAFLQELLPFALSTSRCHYQFPLLRISRVCMRTGVFAGINN